MKQHLKPHLIAIALVAAPAFLAAQQSAQSSSATSSGAKAATTASASANVQAQVAIPANYTAEARAKIQAAFDKARAKQVPDSQMRTRMAEGQAKNASDLKVAAAVQRVEANLETSQSLFIRAGKANPKPEEVTSGEQAIERGASRAQIMAAIKNPPANVTVAAALDALARVGSTSATSAGTVAGTVGGAVTGVNAAAGVGATAGATAGGVVGSVTGAIGGVVGAKKP